MPDSVLAEAPVASGWRAELHLGFTPTAGRTTLTHRHHLGPLRVQRPFYPEGEVCHVYVVHPPGGVVGGDRLDVRITAAAGAHALLTTPAASKFYRSGGEASRQTVAITLDQASLEWLPQETIFYRGAVVRAATKVVLGAGSRFIGWEVACFGLAARDEPFTAGQIRQGFEVWHGERPLLLDWLHLDGLASAMKARWGLAAQPVLGTFVAYPATAEDVEAIRAIPAGEVLTGCTCVDGLLVCRGLGAHADAVMRCFVEAWRHLRPRLLKKMAVAPRIWAT